MDNFLSAFDDHNLVVCLAAVSGITDVINLVDDRLEKLAEKFIALFDDDVPGFDDVARQLEHRFLVLVRRVDRYVGVGSDTEVAFVFQTQKYMHKKM